LKEEWKRNMDEEWGKVGREAEKREKWIQRMRRERLG